MFPLVDKVATGRQSFVSPIAKVVTLFPVEITQYLGPVRLRLSLQLIKGIPRILISTFIVPSLLELF